MVGIILLPLTTQIRLGDEMADVGFKRFLNSDLDGCGGWNHLVVNKHDTMRRVQGT